MTQFIGSGVACSVGSVLHWWHKPGSTGLLAGNKEDDMLGTIKSADSALAQIADYLGEEISGTRYISLWDGLSVAVSNVARRDSNKNMYVKVWVCLDGWTPSEPACTKYVKIDVSKDIPVTENGFVDPEAVLEEIGKVIDGMSTDYHSYMN